VRALAVIDGTASDAPQQARALASFLRAGEHSAGERSRAVRGGVVHSAAVHSAAVHRGGVQAETLEAETLVFAGLAADREEAATLAPTSAVRLVRVPAWRRDLQVGYLAEIHAAGGPDLFLFGPGRVGVELAGRLSRRTGGSVVSGVLDVDLQSDHLTARKAVYSGYLRARFALTGAPLCVSLDAAWIDATAASGRGELDRPRIFSEVVLGAAEAGAEVVPPVVSDVEMLAAASASDLVNADVLVVAGRGAGNRAGIERAAAAAQRMGAAFGVTRPVAMNGWAPMDRIVGVSGVRTAARACIVIGASGAPAFYWGIERAQLIVAVNLDDRAPIVSQADVAIIGDGVSVIEELARLAEQRRPG